MESADITDEELQKYIDTIKEKMTLVEKHPQEFRLELYAYGRQGKFGNNTDPEPGVFKVKEKYKWKAWKKIEGTDKQVARKKFLEMAKLVLGE